MEQQNQQPIQIETETKSPTKTNWKYLAIVVVLGVVVGGGVWWYRISLETESQPPQIITSQQIPTPTRVVETIDTSGWQTYRNEERGFEIKYPAGWRKDWEEEEQEEGRILFGQRGSGPGFSPRKIGMTIQIYKTLSDLPQNKSGAPLDEWVETQYTSLVDQPEETIKETKVGIGEYPGWRIEIFKELGVKAKIPYVYVQGRDGVIFEFEGFVPSKATALGNFSGNYNYQKVFGQMLTTFLQEKGTFSFRKEGDRLIVENGKTYKVFSSKTNPFRPEQTIYFVDSIVSMMIVTEGQILRFLELQGAPNDVRTNLDEMSYFADVNTLVLGGKFGEGAGCALSLSEMYLIVDLRENVQQNQRSFSLSSNSNGYPGEDTQGELETYEFAGDTITCRKECIDQTISFSFEDKQIFSYSTICSNTQKETTLTVTSGGKEILKNVYPVGKRLLLLKGFFDFPVRKNIQLFSDQKVLQFFLDGKTYEFNYTTKELTAVK